ncbi:hypothetical protein RSOLAG22IIIB_08742 [Rhizoctonia solani]|uniref:Uncharacterized protein n=1 Tax=Rhizoctonia solani TaxID=456999 RepID=A0A0K6FUK2_9AGAM|nr:hypothetical protein RSOLAG22IIIB_08742 [Rhizoctonia solani]
MSHSTEFQSLNTITDAKFNELYEAHGKPSELDDAFLTKYFKSLEGSVSEQKLSTPTKSTLDFSPNAPTPLVALSAGSDIIFIVHQFPSDRHIPGLSQVIGTLEMGAPFYYELKNTIFDFVRLKITPNDQTYDRIEFVSYRPCKIPELKGTCTVVRFETKKPVDE